MNDKILSIDPGGTTMGIALSEYDNDTDSFKVIHSTTFNFAKMLRLYPHIELVYGDIFGKTILLELTINRLLKEWCPNYVVCESGYMGKFVTTFASLTKCLTIVRLAVYKYDSEMILHTLDPATVKVKMAVSGQSGDKDLMRNALIRNKNIIFSDDVDVLKLDEHSVDAICIGFAFVNKFKGV